MSELERPGRAERVDLVPLRPSGGRGLEAILAAAAQVGGSEVDISKQRARLAPGHAVGGEPGCFDDRDPAARTGPLVIEGAAVDVDGEDVVCASVGHGVWGSSVICAYRPLPWCQRQVGPG